MAEQPASKSLHRRAIWIDCLALLGLGLAVRLFHLGTPSLSGDELFSVYWSQQPVGFLVGEGMRLETNPPAYFLLLHGCMALFGASAAVVRGVSALISAATVPVTYAIGRTLLDRRTAQLAGLLAGVDPAALMFAQMARTYAAADLFDAIALLALAGCLRPGGAVAARWLGLFLLGATGTLLLHYSSLLFVAACWVARAADWLTIRPRPARTAWAWAAVALVLALPAAASLRLAAALWHSPNIEWIGPLQPQGVLAFLLDLLTHPGMERVPAGIDAGAALLAVLAAAAPRLRFDRAQCCVLVVCPAVFCLLMIGASLHRNILISRSGLWLVVPFCLLLARAITVQPTRVRRLVVGGGTVLVFLLGLGHYFLAGRDEDWHGAARLLAAEPRCAGPILVSGDNALGLAYYGRGLRDRPVTLFTRAGSERATSQFLLTTRILHPAVMDSDAVAPFAAAHPGAAVLLRAVFRRATSGALLEAVEQAPYRTTMGSGLVVACF